MVSHDYSVHIGHNVISVEVFFGYIKTPPSQAVLQRFDRILTDTVSELAGTL